jgi:transcriptional regulator with XRE-family HTH domain
VIDLTQEVIFLNNKATGEFIAKMRKENGYSQKQLAQMLSVTDKAVSKWETGNGAPDISNLIPLSKILGVSVVEILNGEKIENDIVETNEIIIDTMKETKRKEKNKAFKIIILLLLIIAIVTCGVQLSWYAYWSRRHLVLYDVQTVYMTQINEDEYEYRIKGTARNWLINWHSSYSYNVKPYIGGERYFYCDAEEQAIVIYGLHKTNFELTGTFYPTSLDYQTIKSEFLEMNFETTYSELSALNIYMNDYQDVKFVFD